MSPVPRATFFCEIGKDKSPALSYLCRLKNIRK